VKKSNKCVHFNGTMNDTCEAGVRYEDVFDNTTTPRSMPCIEKYNPDGRAKCDKCQFPTADEVAAEEAEHRRLMDGVTKARAAIVAHLGGPWKKGTPGANGRIDCPVCGRPGALGFSRSGYNGHVHAACKTENCVSWME